MKTLQSPEATLSLKERFQLGRFTRGEKTTGKAITLNHRRIFILPNKQGLVFSVSLLLMLLVSMNYNISLGFILTFLLASLSIVSIFHSFGNLAGLTVQIEPVKPVFAGKPTVVTVRLSNNNVDRFRLTISTKRGEKFVLDLPAGETKCISLLMETNQRGLHQLGTVTIFSRFPLGIVRAWSPISTELEYLVYPKPAQTLLRYHYNASSHFQLEGAAQAGEGDFSGLIDYRPGDSLKQVDWKSLAKEQGLFVRQFKEGASSEIRLDWSTTPGHDNENKISQLCRQIIEVEKTATHYSLSLPGKTISPGCGTAHYENCLKQLAVFRP